MQLDDKNVLVLGGSGALGSRISERLAAAGSNVYSVASTIEAAGRIQQPVALRLYADLQSSESIHTLTNYLLANVKINGIINAAGVVGFGSVESTTIAHAQKLMQVNHLGPTQLISELLPMIAEAPSGFVASITGVVAEKTFAGMTAYCASKAAHSAWLSALRLEKKSSNLKVFEFRPGHTETGLADRAIFGTAPKFPTGMQPDFVAEKIVDAIAVAREILESKDF